MHFLLFLFLLVWFSMNKLFSILRIALLSIIVILLSYVGFFWITSLIGINESTVFESDDTVSIYLSTNGVHTDFIVPMVNKHTDWQDLLGLDSNKGGWVAIGWGDRGFYLNTPEWKDLKFKTAFEAISGLGSTALHITQMKTVTVDRDCVHVRMNSVDYQLLVDYIHKYFILDSNDKGILIKSSGYGLNDYFYEAKGSYSAFYTCNTWINQGLKFANQKAAFWTLTDTGILRHYR